MIVGLVKWPFVAARDAWDLARFVWALASEPPEVELGCLSNDEIDEEVSHGRS